MRQCGECTLCCKLLPVHDNEPWRAGEPINKPAGVRCQHQRHGKGCAVYRTRAFPHACGVWNCRWLVNDDAADLRRPDRSHYVIDIMPDYVTARDNETGFEQHIQVVQIWCDPKHRDAWRDPALLAWIERRAQDGIAAIIRFDSRDAINVFAPALASDGQWHEIAGESTQREHTLRDVARALGGEPHVVTQCE